MWGRCALALPWALSMGCYLDHEPVVLPMDEPGLHPDESCAEDLPEWLVGEWELVGEDFVCITQTASIGVAPCGHTVWGTWDLDFGSSDEGRTVSTPDGFLFTGEHSTMTFPLSPRADRLVEARSAAWGVMWMKRWPAEGIEAPAELIGTFCEIGTSLADWECFPDCPAVYLQIDADGHYEEILGSRAFCERGSCARPSRGHIVSISEERALVRYASSWGICTELDGEVEIRVVRPGELELVHDLRIYDLDGSRRVDRTVTHVSRASCPPTLGGEHP